MAAIYPLLGVAHPFDPTARFTTSWLLPPYLLASLRLLLSLYAFATIITILARATAPAARHSFSYFTTLTYWGLAFYFLVAALHTFSYARTGTSWLRRWPRPLQAAHAIFYTTAVTFPFLVSIVFWAVLYRGPWFPVVELAWLNVEIPSCRRFGDGLLRFRAACDRFPNMRSIASLRSLRLSCRGPARRRRCTLSF